MKKAPLPERPVVPSPVDILQQLIRFNTTNPPGNETACVLYVRDLLHAFGIEAHVLAKRRPALLGVLHPGRMRP